MRHTTLLFLVKKNEILLAMKKRGFGIGRWNGVGGKVAPNETIEEAAIREAEEEIGVKINKKDLEKVAFLNFKFINKSEWDQDVTVFFVKKWKGEPAESEEMMPGWYKKTNLPFEFMWPDDPYWLPRVIKGEKVEGNFSFDQNQKLLDGFTVKRLVE